MHDPLDAHESLRAALRRIAPLPDVEFDYLRGHAEVRTYAAGSALIEMGEKPTQCWFLASGFLRFFYITETGREYNKAFARPGEIVAPLSAVVNKTPASFVIA